MVTFLVTDRCYYGAWLVPSLRNSLCNKELHYLLTGDFFGGGGSRTRVPIRET